MRGKLKMPFIGLKIPIFSTFEAGKLRQKCLDETQRHWCFGAVFNICLHIRTIVQLNWQKTSTSELEHSKIEIKLKVARFVTRLMLASRKPFSAHIYLAGLLSCGLEASLIRQIDIIFVSRLPLAGASAALDFPVSSFHCPRQYEEAAHPARMRSERSNFSSFSRYGANLPVVEPELDLSVSSHDCHSTRYIIPQEFCCGGFCSTSSDTCACNERRLGVSIRNLSVCPSSDFWMPFNVPSSVSVLTVIPNDLRFQAPESHQVSCRLVVCDEDVVTPSRPSDPVAKFLNSQSWTIQKIHQLQCIVFAADIPGQILVAHVKSASS